MEEPVVVVEDSFVLFPSPFSSLALPAVLTPVSRAPFHPVLYFLYHLIEYNLSSHSSNDALLPLPLGSSPDSAYTIW